MNILADFAAEFDRCWLCGRTARQAAFGRLEIHHIVRGSLRAMARDEWCTLMRTCCECHESRLDGMAIATQLALKREHDPAGYDRVTVNVLRRRQPEAITEDEVDLAWSEWNKR